MKISVAMAAYNGESYISEQLLSILSQLREGDEIVVSIDPCTDKTLSVVNTLARIDSRIKVYEGLGKGLIKNFENSISRCTGDVIFLSDQDDVWQPDKVETVMNHFNAGADLVLHNCKVVDSMLGEIHPSFFELNKSAPGFVKNIIKNSYMGCCMAFRKELVPMFMPFPEKIPMHDQWIGLIAQRCSAEIVFEDKPLLLYRRHGANASETGGEHAGVFQMIKWRLSILKALRNIYKPAKRSHSEDKV